MHGVMSVHELPGYGMWQRQAGHKAEHEYQTRSLKRKYNFVSIRNEDIKENLRNHTQISNTVHICSYRLCCAQPLYCPPLHMNQVFA